MRRRDICLVLCVLLLPSLALAQTQATAGQITGRVVDSSGATAAGATVTIVNAATNFTREVVTDSAGNYVAPQLPTGTYTVTAALSGFESASVPEVPVTIGANVTVNLALGVAGVTETIEVRSEASPVETRSSKGTVTLDVSAIENLPINGRRFQDFVTLTPTAQVDTQRGQISLSGQRGINSNISIDGADYNQPFFGGIRGGERSNFAFTIPQESIQEFQVVSSGYSAEFGRSSGGVVNAVTKSGSNTVHGSGFYLNRNEDWAKKNAFDQDAAPTQQQFGGSVGGPLTRDRLFYFAAYEQQEFEAPRAVLFDRLSGFTPTADQTEAFDYHKALEVPFADTNDAQAWLGRVDYQYGDGNRFNIRYNGSRNEALNGNSVGGTLFPTTTRAMSNNGTERDRTNSVVGQFTSVMQSNLLVEARAQYSRETRPREANALQPNLDTAIGSIGTRNFLPTTQYDWRAQVAGNVTWITGSHTLKLGTEYNHVLADQQFGFNQYGQYAISGTTTGVLLDTMSLGGAIANRFDTTTVNYRQQIGNTLARYATDEIAAFAQVSSRLTPTFTLDYGLRWDAQFNPTPDANNDFLLDRIVGFQFPIGRTVDPTQIPDSANQFGPRVGFAWDPFNDAKMVVRGFAGVYYARTPALLWAGPINNFRIPAGDVSVQLPFIVPSGNPNNTVYRQFQLIGIDLNTIPLDRLPTITQDQLTAMATALGVVPNPFQGANVIAIDQDFKNPRSTQAGFGVEREVADRLTLGAEFNWVKTDNLQRNRELNLPVPITRANDPAQRPWFGLRTPASGIRRPLPDLGSVQVREATAESEFKALVLSTRLRRSWGQANLFYVLSKSESDDDNERDSGGPGAENNFNLTPEWSPARLDRRHQFTASVLFNLPYEFDIAASGSARSGIPLDATFGSDANEDIGGPDRPFSAPGVPFERNAFRNRSVYDVSVRLQKGIRFQETRKIVLSAEVFNVFNFKNILYSGTTVTNYCATTTQLDCGFSDPTNLNFLQLRDQNPSSTRFGEYLLTNNPGPPLQVQLGVRFQF